MYNDRGDYLGSIRTDGSIYDYHGNYLGSIWNNGYIYLDGSYAGLIDKNGYVYRDGTEKKQAEVEVNPKDILGYANGHWRDSDTGAWIHYYSEREYIEFGYDETDEQSFDTIDLIEISNKENAINRGFSDYELSNWDIEEYHYYQMHLSDNNSNSKEIHMFQSIYITQGSFEWYDPQTQQTYSFGVQLSDDLYSFLDGVWVSSDGGMEMTYNKNEELMYIESNQFSTPVQIDSDGMSFIEDDTIDGSAFDSALGIDTEETYVEYRLEFEGVDDEGEEVGDFWFVYVPKGFSSDKMYWVSYAGDEGSEDVVIELIKSNSENIEGNNKYENSDISDEDPWASYELPVRKLYYDPDNLMSGNDVRYIQFVLLKWDILSPEENGDVSGIFDEKTKAAVMQYQEDAGLEIDGVVGPETLAQMQMDFESITGTGSYDY